MQRLQHPNYATDPENNSLALSHGYCRFLRDAKNSNSRRHRMHRDNMFTTYYSIIRAKLRRAPFRRINNICLRAATARYSWSRCASPITLWLGALPESDHIIINWRAVIFQKISRLLDEFIIIYKRRKDVFHKKKIKIIIIKRFLHLVTLSDDNMRVRLLAWPNPNRRNNEITFYNNESKTSASNDSGWYIEIYSEIRNRKTSRILIAEKSKWNAILS